MNQRFIRVILCFIAVLPVSIYGANTRCECGEFSNGITVYQVNGENSDCCEAVALSDAYYITYTQQSNGVWVVDETDTTTGHLAQDDCCHES